MLDSSIQRIPLRIVCSEMKLRLVTPNRMHSVDFLSSAWQPLFSQLVSSSTYHNSFVYWRQQKAAKIIKNLGRIDESHTNLLWKRISKYPNTKYTYTRRNATSGIPSGSECSSSESERENTAQQLKMVASLAPTAANSKKNFLTDERKKLTKIKYIHFDTSSREPKERCRLRYEMVWYYILIFIFCYFHSKFVAHCSARYVVLYSTWYFSEPFFCCCCEHQFPGELLCFLMLLCVRVWVCCVFLRVIVWGSIL